MNTTIIVILAACAALLALLTYVAFHRGWFRLAPPTSETKGHFVLMLKKSLILEENKQAQPKSKNIRPNT